MSPGSEAPPPSGSSAGDLLPPEVLEGMGSLEMVARIVVRGFVGGLHRSPFLGSGEDFSRHRVYQQGDDVRRLDWRLYGRTDRLHVRLFEERSNLQSFLLVDASRSMDFAGDGAVTKLRYGQFVAAALAHLMLRAGDAVGLASFGSRTAFHLPSRNRPGHLHQLLLALERLESGGDGSASGSLDEVGGFLRRRGRIVLVSDCLEDDDGERLLDAVARLRARGDEVIVVRPSTPAELGEGAGGPPCQSMHGTAASSARSAPEAARTAALKTWTTSLGWSAAVSATAATTSKSAAAASGPSWRRRGWSATARLSSSSTVGASKATATVSSVSTSADRRVGGRRHGSPRR
ncbi:MAG: DUF58 domain-containing protein [Gemmatimonadetes bacterium]|nr:DUF58 domain-containing protein [Gemmatimonadota bacterium]